MAASIAGVAVVVGGGTMGAGVAAAFLRSGWHVTVVEADAASRESLPSRLAGLLDAPVESRIAGLVIHAGLADACWEGVRFVSENVFEDLAVKRAVFAHVSQLAPRGIPLTSNSSTIAAADIAAGTGRENAILNVHFLMPAHQVPLVEVVAVAGLDPHIVEQALEVMLAIGKKPLRLTQALPGFLVNRLQAALMREALALVDAGVASARDVDTAVRHGFGFRYAACGPILQKEHSGWDVSFKVYQTVFPTLANNAEPPAVLREMLSNNRLGMKTGQGFVRWTPATMQVEKVRFNRAMGRAQQVVRDDAAGPPPDWTG